MVWVWVGESGCKINCQGNRMLLQQQMRQFDCSGRFPVGATRESLTRIASLICSVIVIIIVWLLRRNKIERMDLLWFARSWLWFDNYGAVNVTIKTSMKNVLEFLLNFIILFFIVIIQYHYDFSSVKFYRIPINLFLLLPFLVSRTFSPRPTFIPTPLVNHSPTFR